MTYNFDPDKWFENELFALELKLAKGRINKDRFSRQKDQLCDQYDKMVDRLNNTYQLPKEAHLTHKGQ